MKIFANEIKDGLEQKIQEQNSIIYASIANPAENHIALASKKNTLKSIASIDDKDLYYTQSILVTTSWNRNDDIFDMKEVWEARNSPAHKPTNLEHDENNIVGHITANWPITEDGVLIDDNTPIENLPEKFHILTASVIYTGYTDTELKERTQKLIAEIENGTKYVSMECFFQGFDYGITNTATGEYKVLPRNEETSYLTKHLRAYGGLGQDGDYKFGRVLRNITFSGKGFVDRPANPESVIFNKDDFMFFTKEDDTIAVKKNNNFNEEGVFSIQANQQEAIMSSNNNTNDKVEAMKECEELTKEAYAARDAIKAQASELELALAEKDMEMKKKEKEMMDKEEAMKKYGEDMKKKDEEMQKMKAELDAANEVLAAYKSKEEEMMKKEKNMKRMASLIEAGLDNDSAASEVEKFETLADEAFDSVVTLLAAMKPKKEDMPKKEEEAMMKKKASEDISKVLETAEPSEEVALTVGGCSEDELANTRAALVDFVSQRLGKK